MARKSFPVSLLVEDLSLYPRHAIDDTHVGSIVQALRAGVTLPPIVIDQASKRIVDGWHRARAYRRHLGDDCVVDVEVIRYQNEDEMLLDAMERNSSHGRKLDKIDVVRCVNLAKERGISISLAAQHLHIPTQYAEKVQLRIAYADGPDAPGVIPGTDRIALKRPVRHFDGQHVTRSQATAMLSAPGTSYLLLVHQLTEGLREGLVNLRDAPLVEALKELHTEIGRAIRP